MQRKGFQIRIWQWGLLAAIFVFWWAMTKPGFIPAFFFSDDSQAAFFFGEPVIILQRIWEWFAGGEIYSHLGVTLYETVMAFVIGTIAGLAVGLWLALSPVAAAVAGLAANGYLLLCERLHLPGGFRKITTASLITLVCLPLCHLLGTEASHAIIGTLMILTPGIAFTMGIRDFVQGDYLSGTIRMIDALLIAASIAIGTGLVLRLYTVFTGVVVV